MLEAERTDDCGERGEGGTGAAVTVGDVSFCGGSSDSSGSEIGDGRSTLIGEVGATESGSACTCAGCDEVEATEGVLGECGYDEFWGVWWCCS